MNSISKMGARFYMSAESAPHLRTLMAWPGMYSCYPHQLLAARQEVAAVAKAIAKFEPVTLFANATDIEDARSHAGLNIDVVQMEVESPWIRDFGPIFVTNSMGARSGIDFNFNYWGEKFQPPPKNLRLADRILAHASVHKIQTGITAEGGGLEVDGKGTLLATESCIINPNRNAGWSKEDIECELRMKLGAEKVIWLRGVQDADITDCHVDALARFAAPNTILLSRPNSSRSKIWTEVYNNAKEILEKETTADGHAIRVIDLPEPEVENIQADDEYEAVASYVNYYLANGAIVIPSFGDQKADMGGRKILQDVFPDRELIAVLINMLPKLGGGIHCITQQVPR